MPYARLIISRETDQVNWSNYDVRFRAIFFLNLRHTLLTEALSLSGHVHVHAMFMVVFSSYIYSSHLGLKVMSEASIY